MNVSFNDHSKEVLSDFEFAIQRALEAIGTEAEGYAKENEIAVDTGRLRNSITWATKKQEGNSHTYKDNEGKTYSENVGHGADEKSVYIGTNVEYAAGIELGTHRKAGALHFLKRAATEHSDKYKQLVKDSLENI